MAEETGKELGGVRRPSQAEGFQGQDERGWQREPLTGLGVTSLAAYSQCAAYLPMLSLPVGTLLALGHTGQGSKAPPASSVPHTNSLPTA